MTGPADELDSRTGWVIVGLGLVMLFFLWGTLFTFTVYAGALADAFGLSRLRVSSIFSVTTAAFYVAGGVVGIAITRTPLRTALAAAGVALGVGAALLQVVSTYAGLAVVFAVVGTAVGTVFIIVLSVVPQWFDVYEGRAMGVTLLGNGLGILVLPFVWVWLLARTDVRVAFAAVAGTMAALVLLSSLVYRRPERGGTRTTTGVDVAWVRSKLTAPPFLLAMVGLSLLWTWYYALSASLVDILSTAGIGPGVAATAFGAIGGISVLTRLAGGAAADRFGKRRTMLLGVVLAGLGMFVLPLAVDPTVLWVVLLLFGVGLGAIATLVSPVIIGRFGTENATALLGVIKIAQAGTAFGIPIGVNLLFEETGGYTLPVLVVGGLTLAGAALFYWGTELTSAA